MEDIRQRCFKSDDEQSSKVKKTEIGALIITVQLTLKLSTKT